MYGIRDYDGHVTSIEHARTDDIPDRVGQENLDPEKYLLFLSDILSWIKSIVCVEDITSVYAFQWDPNAPGRGVTANALLRDAGNTFLPEWYVREMEDYFSPAGEQQQRKGVIRAMEDEKQRKDENIKMKGIRKRMEESWPRTTSSLEPDVRVENYPPAQEQDARYAHSRLPGEQHQKFVIQRMKNGTRRRNHMEVKGTRENTRALDRQVFIIPVAAREQHQNFVFQRMKNSTQRGTHLEVKGTRQSTNVLDRQVFIMPMRLGRAVAVNGRALLSSATREVFQDENNSV